MNDHSPQPIPRILIIDDILDNLETLGEILTTDYHVQFATSGRKGLALVEQRPPDLILLDVMMPLMDGYEVFAELQRSPETRDIPVIFVTAQNDANNEMRALSAGAVDFISKPINPQVVRARVNTHLTLRQRQKDYQRINGLLENRVLERTQQLEDRTRQVEALNIALEERAQLAEAANRAKSLFLGKMSHELRTPLSAIIGYGELLQREMTLEPHVQKLAKLRQAADHLSTTINDILNFSHIESGKITLAKDDFPLMAILQTIDETIAERAGAKQLRYLSVLDSAIPPYLYGNAVQLEQVLLNLVSNAVKFTPSGSVQLRTKLVKAEGNDVEILFEVEDTGIGIDPAKLEAIFVKFEQGDNTLTREYGGIGLGLSISHKLIELMGGKMGVESQPGKGSRFWITLTFQRGHQPSPALSPLMPLERLQSLPYQAKILLVEDDFINQNVFSLLLAEAGLAFDTANDGAEALSLVKSIAYDLILMDVQMPIMDGLQATQAIRQLPHRQKTPIVAISANAYDEDRLNGLAAGINAFLVKPVLPETLFQELSRWLVRAT